MILVSGWSLSAQAITNPATYPACVAMSGSKLQYRVNVMKFYINDTLNYVQSNALTTGTNIVSDLNSLKALWATANPNDATFIGATQNIKTHDLLVTNRWYFGIHSEQTSYYHHNEALGQKLYNVRTKIQRILWLSDVMAQDKMDCIDNPYLVNPRNPYNPTQFFYPKAPF
jgi:hypothetical protein